MHAQVEVLLEDVDESLFLILDGGFGQRFEILSKVVQLFGFSFSGVCIMIFYLVSLLSSYVDVRATYCSDLAFSASGVLFGIVFSMCFSWRGFLYFNGHFPTYFGLPPTHFIVYFFVAY